VELKPKGRSDQHGLAAPSGDGKRTWRRITRSGLIFQALSAVLAQYQGRLGSLFIFPTYIRFVALTGKAGEDDGAALDPALKADTPAEIILRLQDILGLKKVDRRTLGMKVTSGLAFELFDGKVGQAQQWMFWASAMHAETMNTGTAIGVPPGVAA
jgi:hypothetical protein